MSDRDRRAGDEDGTIDWPTPADPPVGNADDQPTVITPTHGATGGGSPSADATDVTRVRPQTPGPNPPHSQYSGPGWPRPSLQGPPAGPPPPAGAPHPGAYEPPMHYPHPQPGGWPGSQSPAPPANPRNSHKRWWLTGIATAVVVALAVAGGLIVTRNNTDSTPPAAAPAPSIRTSAASPTTTTTTPPPTSTTPAAPPVQPDQLQSYLLSAEDITVAAGNPAPAMKATNVEYTLITGGKYTPAECATTFGPAEQSAYANSGYTGVAAQAIDQGADGSNTVIQAAISFPNAAAAADYYQKTFDQWTKCAGQYVTAVILDNPPGRIKVDDKPSNTSGTAFVSILPDRKPGRPFRLCSRAMTAANNVIADVRSCITDASAGLASKVIAQSIAAKITG